MQVDFYHLAGSPLARVVARIAERVLEQKGRLLIVGDEETVEQLDRDLWSYAAESFLPHGLAGDGAEGAQPVLLGTRVDPANGARNVALADGVWRDEALTFDRVFHFFDDRTIAAARAAWKGLAGRDGVERAFWKQDEAGKWRKVA